MTTPNGTPTTNLPIYTLVNIIFSLSLSFFPSFSILFTACTTVGSQGIKKPKFDEVTMVYPKGYTGKSLQTFSSVSLSLSISLSLSHSLLRVFCYELG